MNNSKFIPCLSISVLMTIATACEETQTLSFPESDIASHTSCDKTDDSCNCNKECASHHCVLNGDVYTCQPCQDNQSCGSDTPYCNTSSGACISCDDIPANSITSKLQDGEACVCDVECNSEHCLKQEGESIGQCGCHENSDCNSENPYCFNGSCVSCSDKVDIDEANKLHNDANCTCYYECQSGICSKDDSGQKICMNKPPECESTAEYNKKIDTCLKPTADNNEPCYDGYNECKDGLYCEESSHLCRPINCYDINYILSYLNNPQNNTSDMPISECSQNKFKVYTGTSTISHIPISSSQSNACIIFCGDVTLRNDFESISLDNVKHVIGINHATIQISDKTVIKNPLFTNISNDINIDSISIEFKTDSSLDTPIIADDLDNATLSNIFLKSETHIKRSVNTDASGLLFNSVKNSKISNLKVTIPQLTMEVNDDTHLSNIGGLFGKVDSSSLEDISLTGTINIEYKDDINHYNTNGQSISYKSSTNLGGMIGSVTDTVLINNIEFKGDFKISNIKHNLSDVGGIAGAVSGSPEASIQNLTHRGNIEIDSNADGTINGNNVDGTNLTFPEIKNVGGIIGRCTSNEAQTLEVLTQTYPENPETNTNLIRIKDSSSASNTILHKIHHIGGLIGQTNNISLVKSTVEQLTIHLDNHYSYPYIGAPANNTKNNANYHTNVGGMIGDSTNTNVISPTINDLTIQAGRAAHVGGVIGNSRDQTWISTQNFNLVNDDKKIIVSDAQKTMIPNLNYSSDGLPQPKSQVSINKIIEAERDASGVVGFLSKESSLYISHLDVDIKDTIEVLYDGAAGMLGYAYTSAVIFIVNSNVTARHLKADQYASGVIANTDLINFAGFYNVSNSAYLVEANNYAAGFAAKLQFAKSNASFEGANIQSFVNKVVVAQQQQQQQQQQQIKLGGFISSFNDNTDVNITPHIYHVVSAANPYIGMTQQSGSIVNNVIFPSEYSYIPGNIFHDDNFVAIMDDKSNKSNFYTSEGNNYPIKSNNDARIRLNKYQNTNKVVNWKLTPPITLDNIEISAPYFTSFKMYTDEKSESEATVIEY